MKLVPRDTTVNTFKLNNVGSKNVYVNFNANPGSSVPASLTLAPGASQAVPVEAHWGGAVFAGLQMGNGANNKIEANFQGYDGTTFFDVDVEKGFSVPVVCTSGDGLITSGCSIDKLPNCPPAQRLTDASGATVACSNPQTSASIALMREGCPNEYVVWDDVQTRATKSTVISCDIGVPAAAKAPVVAAPAAQPVATVATVAVAAPVPASNVAIAAAEPLAPKAAVKAASLGSLAGLSASGAVQISALQNIGARSLAHASHLGASTSAAPRVPVSNTLLLVGVIGAYVGRKLLH